MRVARRPLTWLSRVVLDGEIKGKENLPAFGPYIITANHLSLVDPFLVTLAAERLVQFLAVDELFNESKIRDWLMFYFGSIPISRRRPPLGAIKQALAVLESGGILGVFPEGARVEYWGERPIKRGAAWLSLATNSPLVPCAVIGTEVTMSPLNPGLKVPSVRLSLHPPLMPASYTDREDPLGAIMDDWAAVVDDTVKHWQRRQES